MITKTLALLLFATAVAPSQAIADICTYKPSKVMGGIATGAAGTGAAAMSVAGVGMKLAGFYTLPHAVTGATMLASTAGGASAAGTVGIMGGTAGAIGTIGAALMSPVVIGTTAVVAGGLGVYEGGCYLVEK